SCRTHLYPIPADSVLLPFGQRLRRFQKLFQFFLFSRFRVQLHPKRFLHHKPPPAGWMRSLPIGVKNKSLSTRFFGSATGGPAAAFRHVAATWRWPSWAGTLPDRNAAQAQRSAIE